MKKLQELIMKDLGFKLLSVLIAASLWFMVINIERPVDIRAYSQMLTIENIDVLEERGITVENKAVLESTKVTIKVKAQRSALDRLGQYKNGFKIFLDMKDVPPDAKSGDSINLPVQVIFPEAVGQAGYEIIGKSIATANIKLETIISIEMPVEVEVKGMPTEGFVLAKPVVTPDRVTLTGGESAMKRVNSVKAFIEMVNTNEDVVLKSKIVPLDKSGVEVSGILMNTNEAQIAIGIHQSKKIPLVLNTVGEPKEGYAVGKLRIEPSFIEVSGKPDVLDTIQEIRLPDLDITEAYIPVTYTYTISEVLPPNVRLVVGASEFIKVSCEIEEQAVKEFSFDTKTIQVTGLPDDNLSYSIKEEVLLLQLQGKKDVIDTLDGLSIVATMDLSKQIVGQKYVKIDFSLPDGVSFVGNNVPKAFVTLTEITPTSEDGVSREEVMVENE